MYIYTFVYTSLYIYRHIYVLHYIHILHNLVTSLLGAIYHVRLVGLSTARLQPQRPGPRTAQRHLALAPSPGLTGERVRRALGRMQILGET